MSAKIYVLLFGFVVSLFGMTLPLFSNETKQHRGEFPLCQSTCLSVHSAKMKELADVYRRGNDRSSFQDGVDKVVSEYRDCIDNCRDPLPVK